MPRSPGTLDAEMAASAASAPVSGSPPSLVRTLAVAVAVGAGVAMSVAGIVYAIIAVPFYALARATEPSQGLDRPFIRDGILFALPAGLVIGLLAGVIVGVWYARGGRLPTE